MSKKNIALMLVIFGVGALVYHTITNVHRGDVAAYNNLPQQLPGLLVTPGDIIAVTAKGSHPERICAFEDAARTYDVRKIDAHYVNELGRSLPTFAGLFSGVATGFGIEIGEAQPDAVRFSGELKVMSDRVLPTGISKDCECRMAERLARNERVCTTAAALVGSGDQYAFAVRFKRRSNFVKREMFEACGFKYTPEIEDQMANFRCDTLNSLPWDAELRDFLGLVEPKDITLAQVASDLKTE